MSVIIDPHNYGAYFGTTVGVAGGHPNSMFADLWMRLANQYKSNPKVIFGLMNEPVGSSMTAQTWLASANAAISAIRATGATNHILVPSTYWGHPVNFIDLNASVMINVVDPLNNYSYDVHQYLDYDGSGQHTDYLSPTDAVATLSGFTAWLKANNRKAFLTEIGVTSDPGALASLTAMLQYMHANSDAWLGYTYWSAGPWWESYMFGVQPRNGVDTPQMTTLIANFGDRNSPPPPPSPPEPLPPPEPKPEEKPPEEEPKPEPEPAPPPPPEPAPTPPPQESPPPSEPTPTPSPDPNPNPPPRPDNVNSLQDRLNKMRDQLNKLKDQQNKLLDQQNKLRDFGNRILDERNRLSDLEKNSGNQSRIEAQRNKIANMESRLSQMRLILDQRMSALLERQARLQVRIDLLDQRINGVGAAGGVDLVNGQASRPQPSGTLAWIPGPGEVESV
jgi:Spy/CpxP family protein refolding chaperone